MANTVARKDTPIPTPPRATGDPAADGRATIDWLWQFFESTVVASGLLDPSNQATAQTIDPTNLPDPEATTIATAQLVANLAYKYADAINTALGAAAVSGFPITPPTS